MSNKPETVIDAAIAANLAALAQRLEEATVVAREASSAMENRHRNLAIGTLLVIEEMLPDAQALFSAALALHRGQR
jgi:F0F1-type ATP synthase membrane subunit c/vacuolar-type H+-ATPase subunit K